VSDNKVIMANSELLCQPSCVM